MQSGGFSGDAKRKAESFREFRPSRYPGLMRLLITSSFLFICECNPYPAATSHPPCVYRVERLNSPRLRSEKVFAAAETVILSLSVLLTGKVVVRCSYASRYRGADTVTHPVPPDFAPPRSAAGATSQESIRVFLRPLRRVLRKRTSAENEGR